MPAPCISPQLLCYSPSCSDRWHCHAEACATACCCLRRDPAWASGLWLRASKSCAKVTWPITSRLTLRARSCMQPATCSCCAPGQHRCLEETVACASQQARCSWLQLPVADKLRCSTSPSASLLSGTAPNTTRAPAPPQALLLVLTAGLLPPERCTPWPAPAL